MTTIHFPPPEQNTRLVGHEEAIDDFYRAAASRLHHAWLLLGMEGIGKTTFAFHVANYLLSNGKAAIGQLDPSETNFKLIAAGAHPDLHTTGRPVDEKTGAIKEEIPVDYIRALTEFFRLTSAQGGWRIAIIRDADMLSRNAANALLKILEEPPKKGLILMTASCRGRLLPTIRSRCRSLPFTSLNADQMSAVLGAAMRELTADDKAVLEKLAGGSPGRALRILENDGITLYRDFLRALQSPAQEREFALLRFSAGLGAKAEVGRFSLVAHYCQDWLARLLHLLATGEAVEVLGGEGQVMRHFALLKPLANWLETAENCRGQFTAAIQANLDKRLILLGCLRNMVGLA